MRGIDTVVLVKSTNELAHTLKCIDDRVMYFKTPDYEDYYTESEVEEVKTLKFFYTNSKNENIVRTFRDIDEMIHVFNTHNKYKNDTGITNLRIKYDKITNVSFVVAYVNASIEELKKK